MGSSLAASSLPHLQLRQRHHSGGSRPQSSGEGSRYRSQSSRAATGSSSSGDRTETLRLCCWSALFDDEGTPPWQWVQGDISRLIPVFSLCFFAFKTEINQGAEIATIRKWKAVWKLPKHLCVALYLFPAKLFRLPPRNHSRQIGMNLQVFGRNLGRMRAAAAAAGPAVSAGLGTRDLHGSQITAKARQEARGRRVGSRGSAAAAAGLLRPDTWLATCPSLCSLRRARSRLTVQVSKLSQPCC